MLVALALHDTESSSARLISFVKGMGAVMQVVGFLVLVSGTSLYNELIRSCLPQVYGSRLDSDDAEARFCH